jgi:hypothetical protein
MDREYALDGELNIEQTLEKARRIAARVQGKHLDGGYTVEVRDVVRDGALHKVLVIAGSAPKFDGWSFVARAERLNEEWLVTGSPFYAGASVDRAALRDTWCDHCQTRRARKFYVIVERDGVRKQVGATCVKDFLGHEISPTWFADPFSEFDGGFSAPYAHGTQHVLALAHMVVRQRGYESAQQGGHTRTLVGHLLHPHTRDGVDAWKQYGPLTDADVAAGADVLEFGRGMQGSEYADNLRAVLSADYVEGARLGIAVSAVPAWERDKGKVAERRNIEQEKADLLARGVRVPTGRVTVQGQIVHMRVVEDGYSYEGTWKMVVRSDEGWAVWLTVPAAIAPTTAYGDENSCGANIGDRVEFVATIEASDDPLFGFAKRPSKARVLQAA